MSNIEDKYYLKKRLLLDSNNPHWIKIQKAVKFMNNTTGSVSNLFHK